MTGVGDARRSSRNALLCAAIFAMCWLIAQPFAKMPFIDDFSYTKTALDFARTGHFVYNGWATAMLGWQVPWGALFIKLFGFSFDVLRFSMLPIAMASVYLFHQILRRFGINPANAVLGTLTMALSPLFLLLGASYMTDVPGLFVILLCIYMCQRAVAAKSDKAAVYWLIFATAVNVAGGTVRQIAWLGALVMVPSTAWLLRHRRGMKTRRDSAVAPDFHMCAGLHALVQPAALLCAGTDLSRANSRQDAGPSGGTDFQDISLLASSCFSCFIGVAADSSPPDE